jgi:hypothetical protein
VIENCKGFCETEIGFIPSNCSMDIDWTADSKKLLVKAHERYVYEYNEQLIMTKIHRDNDGKYPFSKLDFLSHKLQEIVFPQITPRLYAANFSDKICPSFLIEKIQLDELHKAYNIIHQKENIIKGKDYYYNEDFFNTDESEILNNKAQEHIKKVKEIQLQFADSINKYGIAFDHAFVNMTWRGEIPVAIEMHKCLRKYLFDYEMATYYFNNFHENKEESRDAFIILSRIKETIEEEKIGE